MLVFLLVNLNNPYNITMHKSRFHKEIWNFFLLNLDFIKNPYGEKSACYILNAQK